MAEKICEEVVYLGPRDQKENIVGQIKDATGAQPQIIPFEALKALEALKPLIGSKIAVVDFCAESLDPQSKKLLGALLKALEIPAILVVLGEGSHSNNNLSGYITDQRAFSRQLSELIAKLRIKKNLTEAA